VTRGGGARALEEKLYSDAYFAALERWHRLSYGVFSSFLSGAVAGKARRALDLGCGTGRYGPLLATLAERVDGCDIAQPALDGARATGAYDRLFLADLSSEVNPLPVAAYDLIFCTEVIEHVADESRFARHVAEALSRGGLLVLTTTTYHLYVFYYWLYHEQRTFADYRDFFAGLAFDAPADRFVRKLWMLTGGHEHGFRRRRLLRALRRAGLTIEASSYANVQPVVPVDGLDEPGFQNRRGAGLAPWWRLAGRALNAGCRETGLYGPNVLVAARR
jgi:2-polyprenyl-3-methyl-5-hydroxy-6-metoxy-1,4-benzoquinol methylase